MPRFKVALQSLNLFYRLRCPIIVEGGNSCGKSTILEEFYRRTSESVDAPVILNIGEQTDAKTLFGAYITNPERPGEFCWKAGVIIEAISSGCWLIIEDVELASPEMIATIKGLLESGDEYYVAQLGRSITIHPNFRLIATSSTASQGLVSAFDRIDRELFQSLKLDSFSTEEYLLILQQRYPKLVCLHSTIIRMFLVANATSDSTLLFKFCSRLETLLDTSVLVTEGSFTEELRVAVLYEALDCFTSSWNSRERRKELGMAISSVLSIPEVQVDATFDCKPSIVLSADRSKLSIGRVSFHAAELDMPRFKPVGDASIALTTLSSQTLEKLAAAVKLNEPVLLVGETGTGKTTTVQCLASMLQHQVNLKVLNMSQQSEASDLLGGFKPFSAQSLARPLLEEFNTLFGKAFSKSKNLEYLGAIREAFAKQSWKRFTRLLRQAIELIQSKGEGILSLQIPVAHLKTALESFESQVAFASNNLLFSFVEGTLIEALKNGHWLLLDEINLASPETLNILAGLLRSSSSSVTLTERGDSKPVPRHPNFRIFACMNPATDVSKRDLPPAIRSCFTQIYVDETDVRSDDLRQVIDYLLGVGRDGTLKERLTSLFYRLKELVKGFQLVDGNGRKPLLNLRTLTRPIKFARSCESLYGLERALYEGWCLSFTTMLDGHSSQETRKILCEYLMPNETRVKPLRPHPAAAIAQFAEGQSHILVDGYVILTGSEYDAEKSPALAAKKFILTSSVQKNVSMLSRAIMARNYPILLEGPTSAGKTSVIEYLATLTGHKFVRINNHEHTDIQEYLGSYASDPSSGKLVFKEGILVQALRKGHWLVLDELNLAPSDILEALNRLLDDNRELFLPETGETIRPHPHFQLFATQNPAGAVYGGRKALSRAFRSRFLELQLGDLPLEEVEQILSSRCSIAPSFSRRIANVYRTLQERRSGTGSNIFAGRHALVTLRDCFRWAERHAGTVQELAEDGFLVLSERCRRSEEAEFIRFTIEAACKSKIDSSILYNLPELCQQRGWLDEAEALKNIEERARQFGITWTKPIKRLFAIVYLCVRFKEPVLLIGETGCGKTTVCQLLAEVIGRNLRILNCHANSESGDFLGSFRPVRNAAENEGFLKLFEWQDGPLIEAMAQGDLFLMDEISLADDSVLERLNSILEPSRTLLLAECTESNEPRVLTATDKFAILATMNPGGDFGKKELSPALRNRFTEVWVPSLGDVDDLKMIIAANLKENADSGLIQVVADFWYWWQECVAEAASGSSLLSATKRVAASLRDLIGWLRFTTLPSLAGSIPRIEVRLLHGAAMIFTDRLGSENAELRTRILNYLAHALSLSATEAHEVIDAEHMSLIHDEATIFSISAFSINKSGPGSCSEFAFDAPTTRVSALRTLRALQLGKAILLEGSPGVGKTTLIGALAEATGNKLTRINLSEQTDLVDLFGSDLPVDGGVAGKFRWCDGPFLQALKRGDWILLDELNLASQSVLEGLNACLDHRGRVFIPELGREFECSQFTRIFAAQNPSDQGCGRKGLPKSFLNRFNIVWFDALKTLDYQIILNSIKSGQLTSTQVDQMIRFNQDLNRLVVDEAKFGILGRPWEFNLRDLNRWLRLAESSDSISPVKFIRSLYSSRFRTMEDRKVIGKLVEDVFGKREADNYFWNLPDYDVDSQGNFIFDSQSFPLASHSNFLLLTGHLEAFEASLVALKMEWLTIFTGPSGSGKSALIEALAALHQVIPRRFFISPDTDTLELLGSFEQVDYQRRWNHLVEEVALQFQLPANCMALGDSAVEELLKLLPETSHFKPRVKSFISNNLSSSEGRFEWVDGPLVRALTLGQWLVLENVNLASPAVLDRLNSLFEPNGFLVLSEQGGSSADGTVRIVRPAPGFRLFMTVDPRFGEISRAMRNRGLEIAMVPSEASSLNSFQLMRKAFGGNDARLAPLLKSLLPCSPQLLQRAANIAAISPDFTVEDICAVVASNCSYCSINLSEYEEFWLSKDAALPYFISPLDSNISLKLQQLLFAGMTGVDAKFVAIVSSFLAKWTTPASAQTRIEWFCKAFNISYVPTEVIQSSNQVMLFLLQSFVNLSESHLALIEKALEKQDLQLFGFLLWTLQNGGELSSLTRTLAHLNQDSDNQTCLSAWMKTWKHFGFMQDNNSPQLLTQLREALHSQKIVFGPVQVQLEVANALETVLVADDVELLSQVGKFIQIAIQKIAIVDEGLLGMFLAAPLTVLYLHNRALNIVKQPLLLKRVNFALEWFSQLWTLNENPSHFFAGFDGLGGLLEKAHAAWRQRSIKDEPALIDAFDDVLKFVVRHGGKEKQDERMSILHGLFEFSEPSALIDSGVDLLHSLAGIFEFDPVTEHVHVLQSSLSTLIEYAQADAHFERLYQIAYKGRIVDYPLLFDVEAVQEKISQLSQYCLTRPSEKNTQLSEFKQISQIFNTLATTLLNQIKEYQRSLSTAHFNVVQASLLTLRMDLFTKFPLWRDLTAPLVLAIDKIKTGLYLCNLQVTSSVTFDLLPVSFFNEIDDSLQFPEKIAALRLASFASPSARFCSSLATVIDSLQQSIADDVRKNTKNDSVFVFKGSNNDDDALDEELSEELFGGKRADVFEKALDENDTMDKSVEMQLTSKALNPTNLSLDLLEICESSVKENKSLAEVTTVLSWIYEYFSRAFDLNEFSDGQVYRMLVWSLSDKLTQRHLSSQHPQINKRKQRKIASAKFDYYRDACPEGRLADSRRVLECINAAVVKNLKEWPEHDVLQRIERLIEQFLLLPVNSTSMNEALLALERLYLRCMDWEKYSSKEAAFGDSLAALLSLIVDWRRAELESWRGLLDSVAGKIEAEAEKEWLVLARVALSSIADQDSVPAVIEFIDTFMIAAPIGQFTKRLQILETCSRLAAINAGTCDNQLVTSAFRTAHMYYASSMAHRVAEYTRMCREPVERDLSAFLMTLYWKDVNYWAVRQVSEKSHRHLAKMVRKWKEAMQLPLSSLLNQLTIKPQLQVSSFTASVDKKQKKTTSVVTSVSGLANRVRSRLSGCTEKLSCLSGKVLEEFGNDILTAVQELKESTEKTIQPKQKAFVDLIRELKLLGVKLNRAPAKEILSPRLILARYACASESVLASDSRAEGYLVKTLEKWQKLSNSVCHEDITYRQAELIRNSLAFFIETLVASERRSLRDSVAVKTAALNSDLEALKYRSGLEGVVEVSNDGLVSFKDSLWQVQVSLAQVEIQLDAHRLHSSLNWNFTCELIRSLTAALTETSTLLEKIKAARFGIAFVARKTLDRICLLLKTSYESLAAFDMATETFQQVSDLLIPLSSLFVDLNNEFASFASGNELAAVEKSREEELLKSLLLTVQFCENGLELPELGDLDQFNFFSNYLNRQSMLASSLSERIMTTLLPAVEAACTHQCSEDFNAVVIELGEWLLQFVEDSILSHYRQISRLTLILSNVFLHLFQEGFCRPPEADEEGATEEAPNGKMSEGTGMGEGEGEKNVSKEIEFEEQVTGTLNEKEEEQPSKEKDDQQDKNDDKEEDRIDMSQDFDVALEDLMKDEEGEEEKEEEEENQDDQDSDQPQDQMNEDKDMEGDEDVQDLDPSWWNSDEDEEEDEEVEADGAQESEDKVPDNKSRDQAADEKDSKKPTDENMEGLDGEDIDEDEEEGEDNSSAEQDSKKEEELADSDIDEGGEDEHDFAEEMDKDAEDAEEVESAEETLEDVEEADEADEDVQMDEEPVTEEQSEESVEEPIETPTEETEEETKMDVDELSEEYLQQKEDEQLEPEVEKSEDEHLENQESTQAAAENVGQTEMQNGAAQNDQTPSTDSSTQSGAQQRVKTLDTHGHSQSNPSNAEPNPLQPPPLADQVEKWKRTIHSLLAPTSDEPDQEPVDQDKLSKEQQYEHAKESDEKAMTVRAEAEKAVQVEGQDATLPSDKAALEAESEDNQRKDQESEAEEKEELAEEVQKLKLVQIVADSKDKEAGKKDLKADKEHEAFISSMPSWPEFEQRTSGLAFDLCEQLRLVLAPTQATKLRGDYRTGKRLNLRKILPYIASQYRRDKIWLRRTKPSNRNYRICMSIDNSKSMMETSSVGLAFEAVATISQALERLEVGELALIGFGEEARVLQSFASGVAKVTVGEQLRQGLLNFDEDSTNIPALLRTVLDTFTVASGGPTWQLNVILSDGICHHHDQIKPLIAQCQSVRIMNIFVLLDNRPVESSIFELSHVEYVEQGIDPMTGAVKTGIKMTKYLETFPFEFYVVLRDVKMLPSVLAEALKQWFELISMQEGEL